MSKLFYLSEIIKFAIEKEQEAYELYDHMEENVTDPKLKELFNMLKGEETKHKEHYSEMLKDVEAEQSPGVSEDEQYKAYMDELIAAGRTAKLTERNINAALDFAIAREKDSILFYVSLKNFVPAAAHDKIDAIIREEGKHAALLTQVKGTL